MSSTYINHPRLCYEINSNSGENIPEQDSPPLINTTFQPDYNKNINKSELNNYQDYQSQSMYLPNSSSNLNYNINNNTSYSDINNPRFSRLHYRLDQISSKINQEKQERENLLHSKINTTEILLDNNFSNRIKKIRDIKESIRGLSSLFEQIKICTKKQEVESDQRIQSLENRFYLRLKEEENKRNNIEKKLSNLIDSKFKDMKCEIFNDSKERFNKVENLKIEFERRIPELKKVIKEEKNGRKKEDEECRTKIKEKMEEFNQLMKEEISKRETVDEDNLNTVKNSLAQFNKGLRILKNDRELNQNKLMDLVDATINQIEQKQGSGNDL